MHAYENSPKKLTISDLEADHGRPRRRSTFSLVILINFMELFYELTVDTYRYKNNFNIPCQKLYQAKKRHSSSSPFPTLTTPFHILNTI